MTPDDRAWAANQKTFHEAWQRAIDAGEAPDPRPMFVPSTIPGSPAATLPWEAIDAEHADHAEFVGTARRCFADHECPYLPQPEGPA